MIITKIGKDYNISNDAPMLLIYEDEREEFVIRIDSITAIHRCKDTDTDGLRNYNVLLEGDKHILLRLPKETGIIATNYFISFFADDIKLSIFENLNKPFNKIGFKD